MKMTHAISLCLLCLISIRVLANDQSAVCDDEDLAGGLQGLCRAYISGKNCLEDANYDHPRCQSIRRNYARKSGGERIDDLFEPGTRAVVGFDGGSVVLNGIGKVSFPQGAFNADATVRVFTTTDEAVDDLFSEFAAIFRPSGRLTYEMRIDTGAQPPLSETIEVQLQIPDDFLANMPDGYGMELFALVEHGSDEEIPYLLFELIPSVYDATNNTVTVELPGAAFSKRDVTDGNYQAIVTLAPTPGTNEDPTASTAQIFTLNSLAYAPSVASTSTCQAASISCPVGGGCSVTSGFNPARKHPVTGQTRPHYGVDYAAATGTPVLAAANGTVERSYTSSSYGETIVVRHTDGSATLYAHMQTRGVNVGDTVTASQQIGTSNNTGLSSGPHLHFEYVPNGQIIQSKQRIDPDACIDALASGSVTVSDSGNLADDAFQVSIDGFVIGQTSIGASNTLAISNLKPGLHTLTLTVVTAPDNVGTYTVTLNDGLVFTDGSTSKSGNAPQGAALVWNFNVPQP